jgi:hypothetical protein
VVDEKKSIETQIDICYLKEILTSQKLDNLNCNILFGKLSKQISMDNLEVNLNKEANFYSKYFNQIRCKYLEEFISRKSNFQNTSFVCYREDGKYEISNFDYKEQENFTHPIVFFLIDTVNKQKVLVSNFELDTQRKRELYNFDKLISYVSQTFSDYRPIYIGKFYLNEKLNEESYLKNLNFIYIFKDLLSSFKIETSILTENFTSKKCKITENEFFYKLNCIF